MTFRRIQISSRLGNIVFSSEGEEFELIDESVSEDVSKTQAIVIVESTESEMGIVSIERAIFDWPSITFVPETLEKGSVYNSIIHKVSEDEVIVIIDGDGREFRIRDYDKYPPVLAPREDWLGIAVKVRITNLKLKLCSGRPAYQLSCSEWVERNLRLGERCTGTVLAVAPYGAFVDINYSGVSGLLHYTNIPNGKFNDLGVKVGDHLVLQVSNIEKFENGLRVRLSLNTSETP